jgi:hypothetical protein
LKNKFSYPLLFVFLLNGDFASILERDLLNSWPDFFLGLKITVGVSRQWRLGSKTIPFAFGSVGRVGILVVGFTALVVAGVMVGTCIGLNLTICMENIAWLILWGNRRIGLRVICIGAGVEVYVVVAGVAVASVFGGPADVLGGNSVAAVRWHTDPVIFFRLAGRCRTLVIQVQLLLPRF